MNLILLIHIFATLFMCGLCWFVQVVHYPLFKAIAAQDFPAYQKKNYITGVITVPVMFIELGTALWLVYTENTQLMTINLVLLALIWLSTFIYQVPTHKQLVLTPTHKLMNKLVNTNWIRTLCWTARSILLGMLVLGNN